MYSESQKTRELEDDLGTLTDILQKIKCHSIKPNMGEIIGMLLEFYIVLYRGIYFVLKSFPLHSPEDHSFSIFF